MIYGYVRVSTNTQQSDPQTIEIKNKYPDATIYADIASGKSLDRPELTTLLSKVKKGDKIVIRELSRLGRSQGELMTLIEEYQSKGVEFEILNIGVDTSSVSGKMILGILASVAQMERELMLERQALGIAKAKADGKYKGKQQSQKTLDKCKEALKYVDTGMSKEKAAKAAGVGIATLYRYIKENN
ncbi:MULTISPECIES: recombinase family protein [Vibrio]|uniref:recombinase family protein n=1 Tax=Vibrio TaxID=662 RepID=UPI00046E8002|nr:MULTISPECIES: recombinase family protein [Vibrio]EHR5760998.1 recombinase family protein [Vibrio parahaemolyticus]MBO0152264.1 recombinase family protein [Vibrio parahaemolyticus]MCA2448368.1 recombinase family protein [Vibrio alginolyticus]MCA2472283.1 recombinase family protein [Vibrio alginolyticus]MDF5276960.1 recombinase family protein [Vibrio parahaemolyticus]